MNANERALVSTVWKHYRLHGRKNLPWRQTRNPYRILVSEVMLQQTQVERVTQKYRLFLKQFPTVFALADATLGDVLRAWQGLGYNRRAKTLHECAKKITVQFKGRIPKKINDLITLPGVGPYTAGAIMVFAFNEPATLIETNVRSVYLHHFFAHVSEIPDGEIFKIIDRTLDRKNPREWYYALMDYGAFIKKEFGNPNRRSRHFITQPAFSGSNRHIRGSILRLLAARRLSRTNFHELLNFEDARIDAQLETLARESLIVNRRGMYQLPE